VTSFFVANVKIVVNKEKFMKTKITDAQRYQANKQEKFIRPIRIAKELGYEWKLTITGSSSFCKTNDKGETVYTPIDKILKEYEKQD
jgi:ribosome-associated translation inhibitor RaiA